MDITEPNTIHLTLDAIRKIESLSNQLLMLGVVKSKNSPLGDFSEHITCLALDLTAQNSTGYDAIAANSEKYEIKSRTINTIRIDGDLSTFDYFVGLFFTKETYFLREAFIASRQSLESLKEIKNKTRTSKNDRLYISINDFKRMADHGTATNITRKYRYILGDNIKNA